MHVLLHLILAKELSRPRLEVLAYPVTYKHVVGKVGQVRRTANALLAQEIRLLSRMGYKDDVNVLLLGVVLQVNDELGLACVLIIVVSVNR